MPDEAEDRFDTIISWALKIGVIVSLCLIVAGTMIVFIHNGSNGFSLNTLSNMDSNTAVNSSEIHLLDIASGVASLSGMYIIALGLWVLIFTPISVVAISFVNFTYGKNRLYMFMSAIVLFNLFLAMIFIT